MTRSFLLLLCMRIGAIFFSHPFGEFSSLRSDDRRDKPALNGCVWIRREMETGRQKSFTDFLLTSRHKHAGAVRSMSLAILFSCNDHSYRSVTTCFSVPSLGTLATVSRRLSISGTTSRTSTRGSAASSRITRTRGKPSSTSETLSRTRRDSAKW